MPTADQITNGNIVAAEFGSTAIYTPLASGVPVEINAVMSYGNQLIRGELYEIRDTANIRAADIAEPAEGDLMAVDGGDYTVDTWYRTGAMWQLVLLPA